MMSDARGADQIAWREGEAGLVLNDVSRRNTGEQSAPLRTSAMGYFKSH